MKRNEDDYLSKSVSSAKRNVKTSDCAHITRRLWTIVLLKSSAKPNAPHCQQSNLNQSLYLSSLPIIIVHWWCVTRNERRSLEFILKKIAIFRRIDNGTYIVHIMYIFRYFCVLSSNFICARWMKRCREKRSLAKKRRRREKQKHRNRTRTESHFVFGDSLSLSLSLRCTFFSVFRQFLCMTSWNSHAMDFQDSNVLYSLTCECVVHDIYVHGIKLLLTIILLFLLHIFRFYFCPYDCL